MSTSNLRTQEARIVLSDPIGLSVDNSNVDTETLSENFRNEMKSGLMNSEVIYLL